jgi:hypothetical protein
MARGRLRGAGSWPALAGLALVLLAVPQMAAAANTTIEGEQMSFDPSRAHPIQDTAASGGAALDINANSYASYTVTTSDPSTYLFVRAEGIQCNGAPIVDVKVDGTSVYTASVSSRSWTYLGTALSIAAGTHTVEAGFTNDYSQTLPFQCDRNLYVDKLVIVGQPFSPTSWRNQPLADNAPIASNSATLVSEFQSLVATAGTYVDTDHDSQPVYTVPPDQPTTKVTTTQQSLQDQMLNVPLPSNAQPAQGQDNRLVLWQPETDSYWGFVHLSKNLITGAWTTQSGGRLLNLSTSDAQFPIPFGDSASGIAQLAGLQRIKELQRGVIDHVVSVALPATEAHVCTWPANQTDGTSGNAIPEGTRFRLPATVNLDNYNLTPYAKMVGKAIQRYGMVVVDKTSGAIAFKAEDPTPSGTDPYTNGIFGGVAKTSLFANFPWDQLQVLDAPDGGCHA